MRANIPHMSTKAGTKQAGKAKSLLYSTVSQSQVHNVLSCTLHVVGVRNILLLLVEKNWID